MLGVPCPLHTFKIPDLFEKKPTNLYVTNHSRVVFKVAMVPTVIEV